MKNYNRLFLLQPDEPTQEEKNALAKAMAESDYAGTPIENTIPSQKDVAIGEIGLGQLKVLDRLTVPVDSMLPRNICMPSLQDDGNFDFSTSMFEVLNGLMRKEVFKDVQTDGLETIANLGDTLGLRARINALTNVESAEAYEAFGGFTSPIEAPTTEEQILDAIEKGSDAIAHHVATKASTEEVGEKFYIEQPFTGMIKVNGVNQDSSQVEFETGSMGAKIAVSFLNPDGNPVALTKGSIVSSVSNAGIKEAYDKFVESNNTNSEIFADESSDYSDYVTQANSDRADKASAKTAADADLTAAIADVDAKQTAFDSAVDELSSSTTVDGAKAAITKSKKARIALHKANNTKSNAQAKVDKLTEELAAIDDAIAKSLL